MKRLCLLLAVSFAPAAGAAFKCVDENGLTHIGDTPPAGCANVVMYETSASGMVLRKIDPTPTAEQLKARQDEYDRMKDSLRGRAEQKRKDDALLNTFSGEKEFDVVRDRNIEPVRSRIKSAEERIKAVDKRQKELEEEMEFYKEGKSKVRSLAPPPQLAADLNRLRTEHATLKKNIENYEREIEHLRARFDADKKRWVALKAGGGVALKPPEPEAKPDAKAAKK